MVAIFLTVIVCIKKCVLDNNVFNVMALIRHIKWINKCQSYRA